MIREDGTPILLEVNAAPSLTADHIVPHPGRTLLEGGQRVRSIVDEVIEMSSEKNYKTEMLQVIKIPLVRDTLLLVLGLMEEEYQNNSL